METTNVSLILITGNELIVGPANSPSSSGGGDG